MGMRRMLLAVMATALAALAVSCSGGSGSKDAGPTVFSCQDIRICALDYADDAMVMTNCGGLCASSPSERSTISTYKSRIRRVR